MAGARLLTRYPYNPVPEHGKLTLSSGVITDVTRLAGVQGDGAAYPDSSVGVWPAATNIALYSGDFSNASWISGAAITKTSTTETDPGGGSTALLATITNVLHALRQQITVTASTTYTFSWWAKKGTASDLKYSVYDLSNAADIVAGTSYGSLLNTSSFVRVSVTFTTPVGCTAASVYLARDSGATGTAIFAWPQLEAVSIATPYIPTDGGTASRSAASISVPVNGGFTESQGWWAFRMRMNWGVSAEPKGGSEFVNFAHWGDDTSDEMSIFYREAFNQFEFKRAGWTNPRAAKTTTHAAGDYVTLVGWWIPGTTDDCYALSLNGSAFAKNGPATTGSVVTISNTNWLIGSSSVDSGRQTYTDYLWFAAGKGTLTDADAALFNSWGNNDPLPHMFPRSAQLTFLARFNGDGTAYRYSV